MITHTSNMANKPCAPTGIGLTASPLNPSLRAGGRAFNVLLKMRLIALTLIIGLLPVTGCKQTGDRANYSEAVLPLYEDRVFEQDKVSVDSRIDISSIDKLEPWNKDLLLKLFAAEAGTNTVYTYKSTYRILENIDGTGGAYDEYLIVEANKEGVIKEALLYDGGPKQGPLFHSLYRASKSNLHIKDLNNTSQFKFVCPYESGDRNYYGSARINNSNKVTPEINGEQGVGGNGGQAH